MSILRTARFLKHIGSVRRIHITQSIRKNVILTKQADEFTFLKLKRCFSLVAQQATREHYERSSLDRSIRKLDEDARRMGRISIKELNDVIKEIQSSKIASSTQALMVIRCCGNLLPEESPEFRTKLVEEVWSTLEKLGVVLDVSHYNALLRVYLENEHEFSPVQLLTEMERAGVEPNRVTLQRLVAAYCQRADLDGATRILEHMRSKQMPVGEAVFNALIMGHARAHDMAGASAILPVMKQAGLAPNCDTYTALLCGYASHGDLAAVETLLSECEANDVGLGDRHFLEVIYTLAVNSHEQFIDFILSKMGKTAGYNQDAANIIIRLTTKGREDIAFKIYETMLPVVARSDGQTAANLGAFFIRQLVKANRPVESIVKICEAMKENGHNSRALLLATETALASSNTTLALALVRAMHSAFYPIRPHYFWPMLVTQAKHGKKEVLAVLSEMSSMSVRVNSETLKEYVLPAVLGTAQSGAARAARAAELISELKECGVSIGVSAASITAYLLVNARIADAAAIASSFQAVYKMTVQRSSLVNAFLATKDVNSLAELVHAIIRTKSLPRQGQEGGGGELEEAERGGDFDEREYVGRVLLETIARARNSGAGASLPMKQILQKFLEHGLGVSNSTAEQIRAHLSDGSIPLSSEEMTEVTELLTRLTSLELSPTPLQRKLPIRFAPRNEESLLAELRSLESRGENTNGIKKQLFTYYCAMKDVEKVEALVKRLEGEGYVIATGMQALLIELYLDVKQPDRAFELMEALRQKEPDIKLDNIKAVKLAQGLVEADRLQDALLFVKSQRREEDASGMELQKDSRPLVYSSACWRLLNACAEKGDAQGTRQLFDALVDNHFIQVSNVYLGPLVKAHLVNDNLAGALDVMEWACHTHRATPLKRELSCALIKREDASALQRLTDLSTIVHGEINSLHDLIIAFIECGRIRQARKILETPGLRVRNDRLLGDGDRLSERMLEGLLEATRDIGQVDRAAIFALLLANHIKQDNAEKALGLWTQMQEENVQPSDQFLHSLGTYLTQKDLQVPFTIPTLTPQPDSDANVPRSRRKLKLALASKDWNACSSIVKETLEEGGVLLASDIGQLLQVGFDSGVPVESIAELGQLILANGKSTIPRAKLAYLAKQLAQSGNVQALDHFGNFLTDELRQVTKYQNLRYVSYIKAGKVTELLASLEKRVRQAKSADDLNREDKIPIGGMLNIVRLSPELRDKVVSLADECHEKGISLFGNIVWLDHIFKGEQQAAEEAFKKYLKSADNISFRIVSNSAIRNVDEQMIDTLLGLLEQYDKVTPTDLASVYSSKINILLKKNEPDRAMQFLESVSSKVPISKMSFVVLSKLKTAVTNAGKNFPFDISKADKKMSASRRDESSDSDSDDSQPNHRLSRQSAS